MRYSYECEACGYESIEAEFRPVGGTLGRTCDLCGGLLRRIVCFAFKRGMREHFNPTIGRYVTSSHDFAEGLKQASESASLASGLDHNFVPVDLRDPAACGVTDEGLDDTFRKRHNAGLTSHGESAL
jgi:hypothetical protein